jgi:hypothetical protein
MKHSIRIPFNDWLLKLKPINSMYLPEQGILLSICNN